MKMEEIEMINGCREVGSSNEARGLPPNPIASAFRQCYSATCKKTKLPLVRHPSLMNSLYIPIEPFSSTNREADFLPSVRSGAWTDIGFRSNIEYVYVCHDDFLHHYGLEYVSDGPNAFYGVFDGHGGKHAADFACCHLPRFILEDVNFPREMHMVITSAFLQTHNAFAEACSLDTGLASGTTALTALVMGRLVFLFTFFCASPIFQINFASYQENVSN